MAMKKKDKQDDYDDLSDDVMDDALSGDSYEDSDFGDNWDEPVDQDAAPKKKSKLGNVVIIGLGVLAFLGVLYTQALKVPPAQNTAPAADVPAPQEQAMQVPAPGTAAPYPPEAASIDQPVQENAPDPAAATPNVPASTGTAAAGIPMMDTAGTDPATPGMAAEYPAPISGDTKTADIPAENTAAAPAAPASDITAPAAPSLDGDHMAAPTMPDSSPAPLPSGSVSAVPGGDTRLKDIESKLAALADAASKTQGGKDDLSAISQKLDALAARISALESARSDTPSAAPVRTATTSPAIPRKAVTPPPEEANSLEDTDTAADADISGPAEETVVATPAPAPVKQVAKVTPRTRKNYVLKAVSNGTAYIALAGSQTVIPVTKGTRVDGLGTVEDIYQRGSRWVVKADGGVVTQ